jgi:hypothetical protein
MLLDGKILKSLIDSGLTPINVSEITRVSRTVLQRIYEEEHVTLKCALRAPTEREVTIALMLMKRENFDTVLSRFTDVDPNILYDMIKDRGVIPFIDIKRAFSYKCSRLIREGLSFRNLSLLCAEMNDGVAPEPAALRRRILNDGFSIKKDNDNKRVPTDFEKATCLRYIQLLKYRPVLDDFVKIYFYHSFSEYRANNIFRMLLKSNELHIHECLICNSRFIGTRHVRFCKKHQDLD